MKINIVSALHLLADTESHHTPNDKLRGVGFERAENEQGVNLSWCREARTEHGALIILRRRFLSDEISVGFHEDGQITVAKLEIGEQASHDEYEESEFRQRQASDAIDRLLSELG